MKRLAGVWMAALLVLSACGTTEAPPVAAPQAAPKVIAQWTFDNATLEPTTGSGVATAGPGLAGESFVQGNPPSGSAWSFSGWGTGGLDAARWVEFAFSTQGVSDLTLRFDERRSGMGPSAFEVRYSTDGVTFTALPEAATPTRTLPNNTNFRTQTFDLSGAEALNDQERVALRIYGYGASSSAGTWRFDNVTVSGVALDGAGGAEPQPAACALPSTPIHAVQSGAATGTVTVEGVVTADFRGGLNGFFIQDVEQTAFPTHSDGVFVFTPSGSAFRDVALEPGDLLRVTARVGAFQGATQLTAVSELTTCLVGVAVEPVALTLPLDPDARAPYVGMLTTLPQDLTVTETFLLGRFGMLSVAVGGRLFHPNNGNVPGAPEAIRADNVRRRLVIDDGSAVQNPELIPFLSRDLGNTIRVGDTMRGGVTGVMSFGRPSTFAASGPEDYRLHVIDTDAPEFSATNPRPEAPAAVGGELKVAAFNVLNYFTTFGQRGAGNAAEFARQRAKLFAALRRIDADVVGLIEIENNGDGEGSAIRNLVDGLNEVYGGEVYAVVPDPADTGTDAIKQALIYKPAALELVAVASDSASVHNRPPVAATFRQRAAPHGVFTAVVAHHKSKRCSEGFDARPGDTEQAFEGCFNQLRTEQSQALAAFAAELKAARGDTDVLLMGDLNAYALEDPITTLTRSGFENLTLRLEDEARYSFVFDGESGTLDYALASPSLAAQVTGIDIWHINPDEPRALEYNSAPRFGGEDRFTPTPYRSSDHDPVIIGLSLTGVAETEPEPTPQEALKALKAQVEALAGTLNRNQLRALETDLDSAERHLNRNRRRQAEHALRRFEDSVRRLVRRGTLSAEQGRPLLEASSALRARL